MVTLAEQDGGPEVSETFAQEVLVLRKLLAGLETEDYSAIRPEFALALRVDGSLTKFGPEGVESPKLRKSYIQVDIVVSEDRWKAPLAEQRRYLAKVVGEALMAILDKAEQKGLPANKGRLAKDYAMVCERFFKTNRRGIEG